METANTLPSPPPPDPSPSPGLMIEKILPTSVVFVEAFDDPPDISLFPEEEKLIERAVDKRRREFSTGRDCAHRALRQLGLPAGPIENGEKGEPLWPDGAIGSITHCADYRACAAGRLTDIQTLGIDAEPHEALPAGLLRDIARPEERDQIDVLTQTNPTIHWDRLIFSAKEAVYKAWYPLAKRWLGFEDATLTVDTTSRTFQARLLVPGPTVDNTQLTAFKGGWLVQSGLVITAITLARPPRQTSIH